MLMLLRFLGLAYIPSHYLYRYSFPFSCRIPLIETHSAGRLSQSPQMLNIELK